ncbi:hypothetical protein DAPPUDRAFT_323834 [Daphnia pulex]|uniref:Uncharacterized protein n=1 Tax=Daphnia pulex TaxID=6669 RepID=E9GZW8_DAPPU|nr:hypothetical protein DAPPUDRAFT_323834 [Daphnia pulex]|eukprot:EFX74889.1 hypothetical protein DAPPUDRAFT_323834 [Daphnia pulex]
MESCWLAYWTRCIMEPLHKVSSICLMSFMEVGDGVATKAVACWCYPSRGLEKWNGDCEEENARDTFQPKCP